MASSTAKRAGSAALSTAAGGRKPLRVVSLLPSATENFSALLAFCESSRKQQPPSATSALTPLPVLVGRSHECDFPTTPAVQSLPVLTAPRTAFTSSADTHTQVRQALADAASLYHLDAEQLAALAPDVILTQSSCKVCSIDLATVESSVSCSSSGAAPPIPQRHGAKTARIVTCNPTSLLDALSTQFEHLGRELGVEADGDALAQQHRAQLALLQQRAQSLLAASANAKSKPRVLLVEWLDPLFIGNVGWMREIIECAGGDVVASLEDEDESSTTKPIDVVVVALCGLSLDATEREIRSGRVGAWWHALAAAQVQAQGRLPALYLVDGTSMFSRPTQRLLLALEWLVHVLHAPVDSVARDAVRTFPSKQIDFATALTDTTATLQSTLSPELLEIEELHTAACRNQQAMYTDPATGYSVMTAYHLLSKQRCCGNACRHCPFGHANVRDPQRRTNAVAPNAFLLPSASASVGGKKKKRMTTTTSVGGELLWPVGFVERETASESGEEEETPREVAVMFWSGGKDSFLALSELYASYAAIGGRMPQVVLLTTIDPVANNVPIQQIDVATIAMQAQALHLPLSLVAISEGSDYNYTEAVLSALARIPQQLASRGRTTRRSSAAAVATTRPPAITRLVFGDLHLTDIRNWREQTFGTQYELSFPLWQRDYARDLLPLLDALCQRVDATLTFSAVDAPILTQRGWCVGDVFDWQAVAALNSEQEALEIDHMGERGEFHTCVRFAGMDQ